jgi:hypothetical protein
MKMKILHGIYFTSKLGFKAEFNVMAFIIKDIQNIQVYFEFFSGYVYALIYKKRPNAKIALQ